jgi:hypothetical protein
MTIRVLVIVLCFFSYVNTKAQTWKKDIESSIEALNKATISPDKSMLEKLTAEELSYGHSTGLLEDKATYVKDILSGPTKFFQIDNADQTITLAGDIAIVRNVCSIKGTKDGAPMDTKIGVLMIWKKDGADWKLLARQGYKLQ